MSGTSCLPESSTVLSPVDGLTVKEAAYLLGVSHKTVYSWCRDKKIPHFKIVGTIYIKKKVVGSLVHIGSK
jgi:excisionase family DNA binding protein